MSSSETLSLHDAMARLASERSDLALNASNDLISLDEAITGPQLDAWLANTATLYGGLDARTAAAYLTSMLVWRLGDALASLYLMGAPLPPLSAANLRVTQLPPDNVTRREYDYSFGLPETEGQAQDRAAFTRSLVAIHTPLVEALQTRTGLSQSTLWRLVTDGFSNGFLAYAKRSGGVDQACAEARLILADAPLHNKQWHYLDVSQGDVTERFRMRGGCCRIYRSDAASYCSTCVMLSAEDKRRRIEDYLRERDAG